MDCCHDHQSSQQHKKQTLLSREVSDDHSCHDQHHQDHQSHGHHNGHDHHGHGADVGMGMGHGSAQSYIRRFAAVTVLLVPLALTNPMVAGFLNLPELAVGKWVQLALATIIFFAFALVFFQHAWHEIKARRFGMMTLVSVAVGAGFVFSVVATFVSSLQTDFYLEISTLVWVLLFGHYLEARSGSAAGDALSEVAKLLPKKAHRRRGKVTEDVAVDVLRKGDMVLVKPGEKVPADGVVTEGQANVNEAYITGESEPVAKKTDDRVVAGAVALDGSLTITVTRIGEHSTIGQIKTLISNAAKTKPRSQRLADRASSWLTFIALGVAGLTFFVWMFGLGSSFVFAITLAITVLVIACPHALGLAIPTVTTIATTLSAKNGVFIKDLSKVEVLRQATYVVFDKTGTLTKGSFAVTEVVTAKNTNVAAVLRASASLEQYSSHVIGQAIVAKAREYKVDISTVTKVQNVAGLGMKGMLQNKACLVGNEAFMNKEMVSTGELLAETKRLQAAAQTLVYVALDGVLLGIISLADQVRPEAHQTVKQLHTLGVKVAMITGDQRAVAAAVAKQLGIDTYFAEVLPEDKYTHIKQLQEKGQVVLMVGDGVNDAPALTQADAGVAIGAGTDVAVEAGDVVLTRSNPADVVTLLTLARKVYVKMRQNLWWALGYNVVAIPAAAGVFAAWGFFLRPEIGALLMSLSTVIVVINALTLRRVDLKRV